MNQDNKTDTAKEIAKAQALAMERRNEATERIRIKKSAVLAYFEEMDK